MKEKIRDERKERGARRRALSSGREDFNHVNTSIADMQLSHYDYMVNAIKLRNITLIFYRSACGSSFIFFSFTSCQNQFLHHKVLST